MKKSILFILLALISVLLNAQTLEGERYKGYVDFFVSPGNDGVYYKINTIGVGGITSHGYQVNPHIFFGSGIGVQYFKFRNFDSGVAVPVFGNFRANFTKTLVSPYFDVKIGYSIVDVKGVFISPSIGFRLGIMDNEAINLQFSYNLQGYKYYDYYYFSKQAYAHCLNISLGFEW